MPGFDVQGALKSGYSPAEVADYLGSQQKFDVAGARKAGYSDQDIISHLTQPPANPSPAATAAPPQTMQQGADAAQASDIDKLKSIGRGFVNTLEESTDDSLPAGIANPNLTDAQTRQLIAQHRQQNAAGVDQSLGLGNPTGGLGEFIGSMAAPMPGGGLQAADTTTGALGKLANAPAGQTVGQVLQSRPAQMFEQALSYIPGGGSIIKAMQNQADTLGTKLDSIVDSLRGGRSADAEDAGSMLTSSLTKAAARIRAVAGKPFDDIADSIPAAARIGSTATRNTLEDLTAVPRGGEATAAVLQNPQIVALRDALEKDVAANGGSGAMPMETMRALKTKLGGIIDFSGFGSNPTNGALKQVWKALNQDIMDGARATDPKLAPAIAKANAGYQVAQAQLDNLSAVVDKAGGPDKIFTSLMAGTKDGSLTLRRVLTQLSPSDKQLLAAAQLRRMGTATAGAQATAEGGAFSADTFLTNWNKMAPDAREALFGRLPEDYATHIQQLAKNVATLKTYARVMPNWSGTTRAAMWAGDISSALTSLMLGHPGVAAGLAGTAAGTKILASAMTNPKTVAWLAKQTMPALWTGTKAGMSISVSQTGQ